MTPKSTFKPFYTEAETTYIEYYKTKYDIVITDTMQFMLISKSKERDLRAGKDQLIYLIPELSRATGMTDEMRNDFKLMQKLSNHTRLSPNDRVKQLLKFNQRVQKTPESVNVLNGWNMELAHELTKVPGRELPTECIVFGNKMEVPTNAKGEWICRHSLYHSAEIKRWVVIYPKAMATDAANFVETLKQAANSMKCDFRDPRM